MPNLYEPSGKQRISSIDILRGVIMLIMALDHTRDFFHLKGVTSDATNLATTTPILFFTRWITHFCAPNFVFLSGISAYIAGTRRTKTELSTFLIKRGLWLVFVELVILTFAFTLNPFFNVIILQVLWVIGLSMVILGLLVKLPLKVIAVVGALIFFGHDLLDSIQLPKSGIETNLVNLFFTARGTIIPMGKTHLIADLYAVIPWTGVMLLGYVCGSMYNSAFDAQRRRKILLAAGLVSLFVFVVIRYFNLYGEPLPWSVQRSGTFTFLSFLNVSKYPPSLMFCLMTVGVGMVVLALTEKVHNKLTAIFVLYGSVPFFYYILHFYLLRITCIAVFYLQGFGAKDIVDPKGQNPFNFIPPHFGFPLGGVYTLWLCVIIALYWPCRWFSRYKKTHKQWWLSYL